MSSDDKKQRPPKDLSVPETMKIAALLAELMPPGAMSQKPAIRPTDSLDDIGGNNLSTPSLEIEDLDDVEPVAPAVPVEPKAVVPGVPPAPANVVHVAPRPVPTPRISAVITPAASKPPSSKSTPPTSKSTPPASKSTPPTSKSTPPASKAEPPAPKAEPPAPKAEPPRV